MITAILMRYGLRWVLGAVLLATGVLGAWLGMAGAVAGLAGGALAGLSFLGLTWGVSRLMDETVESGQKARTGAFLAFKLLFVGVGMYLVIVEWALSPLGITFGIGGAIFGLTVGLSRATASPEGRAALEAESQRIERALGSDRERPE